MERNYDKPYRGLPTEIRLEIWKLLIPETGHIQPRRIAYGTWDVELPTLQTQLLRLNQEVHSEILPIFKKIKVNLLPDVNLGRHWAQVSLALDSPILETLELRVERRNIWPSKNVGIFLFRFLSMNLSHPLHTLIMDLDEVDHRHHGYCKEAGFTEWLTDDTAIATFAAAFLKRGLVREVRVNIRDPERGHVNLDCSKS